VGDNVCQTRVESTVTPRKLQWVLKADKR